MLAERTDGFTGAYLKELVVGAFTCALDEADGSQATAVPIATRRWETANPDHYIVPSKHTLAFCRLLFLQPYHRARLRGRPDIEQLLREVHLLSAD